MHQGEDGPVRTACVCEGESLRAAFRDDLDRYVFTVQTQHGSAGRLMPARIGLLSQGLWVTTAYRLNHYARNRFHSRSLTVMPSAFHRVITMLTGIHIDAGAHIGPGLKFPHGGRIEMGPVRVGRNCDIYQGVTLGAGASTLDEPYSKPGVPTLGDRVWVGPGAVVSGEVAVGDDASVGANSLLVRDVPPRGVVLGVPARLVAKRGSFTQIMYRAMDADDSRKVSLAADPEAGPRQAP
jgi:serine O-acetyltransferase